MRDEKGIVRRDLTPVCFLSDATLKDDKIMYQSILINNNESFALQTLVSQ